MFVFCPDPRCSRDKTLGFGGPMQKGATPSLLLRSRRWVEGKRSYCLPSH